MPVVKGVVKGQFVTIWRDSGSSNKELTRSLVRTEQFIGLKQLCVLLDAKVKRVDYAKLKCKHHILLKKSKEHACRIQ